MSERRTPVLVVGGALTGLSAAVFLAWHGVSCVLVERHPDLLIHPRLRGVNPRTMELFRQVGLEEAVIGAATPVKGWFPAIAGTLADEEYKTPEEPVAAPDEDVSPCAFVPIDQDRLEILLRARAEELGADVRFSTELTDLHQDADGVTATITGPDGRPETIRAGYLVAADGAGSPIRRRLGVPVDGPGVLFHTLTVMADADLTPALRGRPVSIAYLDRPRPGTVLMAHDDEGKRWIFGVGYSPEHESPADYSPERCAALLREAAGLPDVEVAIRPQIPGTDAKVLGFAIGARLARDYRVGRILLAGDAAHIVPPTGGLGGSTCVQDAHNLAWKLAAVLGGRAGPALLDTYHAERHPVGALTLRQAQAFAGGRMGLGDGRPAELIDPDAMVFGYGYPSPGDEAPVPLLPRELRGRPGHRAPHVEVTADGRPISTLDLYGRRWVLLSGSAGDWADAAAEAGAELDLPIDVYRFGADLRGDGLETRHGIDPDGALLVRPDGFVAWSGRAGASLAGALRGLLRR